MRVARVAFDVIPRLKDRLLLIPKLVYQILFYVYLIVEFAVSLVSLIVLIAGLSRRAARYLDKLGTLLRVVADYLNVAAALQKKVRLIVRAALSPVWKMVGWLEVLIQMIALVSPYVNVPMEMTQWVPKSMSLACKPVKRVAITVTLMAEPVRRMVRHATR